VRGQLPCRRCRILELGQIYNAPYCGLLLAAQGADVVKVEPPGGEIVRRYATSPGGASYSFLMLNADKRGITLDLKHPRGRALLLDLAEHADVVLENFRHGVLDALGLGWDALHARNERLVLASGRGYRPGSPYERYGAMDVTIQAISGHMAITGFPDRPPVKAGATLSDMLGAVHLFAAILLALRERDRTGRGRAVEVAMLDATFPALMAYASPYLETGVDPGRTGNRHSLPRSGPYGVYPTRDGWIALTCVTDAHWAALVPLLDDPELRDPTLDAGAGRAARRDWLDARVGAWTARHDRDALAARLARAGVPCAPVRSLAEAVEDPYLEEHGLLRRTTVPGRGEVRVLGSPIRLDGTPPAPATPPPALGQHTREVLGTLLGLDDAMLDELAAAGVI
jgi:CoA:oxalate CoA-transferase